MPLSEFLRLAIEKLESSKKKSCSTDASSRTENNLVEVVWENGSTHHSFSPHTPAVCDSATANLGGVDSIFNDISPVVPSGPLDLSYPVDDAVQDYGYKRTPESSCVLSAPNVVNSVNSGQLLVKEHKESFPVKGTKNFFEDTSVISDRALAQCNTDNSTVVVDGDTSVEPVVACGVSFEQKRKACDIESECHNDDVQHESVGVKKQTPVRGCTGSKRSRTTEVHNLSERRRRDRINEKMRALQELIPNCNKADKASMLDEAIQYLKNLQYQVHILSMGGGFCIPPMMYPAPLPHFSPMGIGTSMSFGNLNGVSPLRPIFPAPSFQGARFPFSTPGHMNFQGISSPHLPTNGHVWPGLDSRVPQAPLMSPLTGSHVNASSTQNKVPSKSSHLNFGDPMSNKNLQNMDT